MPRNTDFTRRQKSQESQAKSAVVSKFFVTWAQIVGRHWAGRLCYADLFAGAGYHGDTGEKSTALITIDVIARTAALHDRIDFLLNDREAAFADALIHAVSEYPGSKVLNSVRVTNDRVIPSEYEAFLRRTGGVPTFWFLDPTGWDGLYLDGIVDLTRGQFSDLVFFLSYENINRFITEESVQDSLSILFGVEALREIQAALPGCASPEQRERLIVTTLRRELMQRARFSECMRFGKQGSGGTSHYLIFVTKHPKGRRAFLSNVSAHSNWKVFGMPVAGFGSSRTVLQPSLFRQHGYEDDVEAMLTKQFGGMTLKVDEVIDQFFDPSISLPESAVKGLIQDMEAKELVTVDRPAANRPLRNGKRTLGNSRIVTFHKE